MEITSSELDLLEIKITRKNIQRDIFRIYFLLWSSSRGSFSLHWFRDIYRRYFLRNIQRDIFNLPLDILNIPIISLVDYKEKIEIYTKYLEKKSNWVSRKYMRLHRWISQVQMQFVKILQVEIVHFASWICDFATWRWFRNLEMISQLGDDFVTWFVAWRWFRNLICSCENGIWTCEVAHVCLQVVSQVDFAAMKFSEVDFAAAKFSLSLVRLSSNGHNFFVSAPIYTLFKELDSWLPELKKNI